MNASFAWWMAIPLVPITANATELPDEFLVAVSLRSLADDDCSEPLMMTSPVAIVGDGCGDGILLGRIEPELETLILDDARIAFSARYLVDFNDAPGVSLEPWGVDLPRGNVAVRFTGQIRDTAMGWNFLIVDILLKLLGMGYESTGVRGLPSEWDLDVHQRKLGHRVSAWDVEPVPLFFFPSAVRISTGDQAAALSEIIISVLVGDSDRFHEMLRDAGVGAEGVEALSSIKLHEVLSAPLTATHERIDRLVADEGDRERARRATATAWRYASNDSLAAGDIRLASYEVDAVRSQTTFSTLLSAHMDELVARYPVLRSYKARLALLGLARTATEVGVSRDLQDAIASKDKHDVATPPYIPAVERRTLGLGHAGGASGGLSYLVQDAKGGSPDALRDLALLHRPDTLATCWVVPLTSGSDTAEWPGNTNPSAVEEVLAASLPVARTGLTADISPRPDWSWAAWLENIGPLRARETPGWRPTTAGENLVEVEGNLAFGTQDDVVLRTSKLSIEGPKDLVSISYVVNARSVLSNRLEVYLTAPFEIGMTSTPVSERLPDVRNIDFQMGVSNIEAGVSALLFAKEYGDPSFWALASARYETPLRLGIVESQAATVGTPGSVLHMGPTLGVRSVNKLALQASVYRLSRRREVKTPVRNGWGNIAGYDVRQETEGGWTYVVNPSVRLGGKVIDTLGCRFVAAERDLHSSTSYELYASAPSRGGRWLRAAAGLTRTEGNTFYSWSLEVPFDFASFRWRRWSGS